MRWFILSVVLLLAATLCSAPVTAELPEGWWLEWQPGDGHVHSKYSDWDFAYGFGKIPGPPIGTIALAAVAKDLKWVIITDHEQMYSSMSGWYPKSWEWQLMKAECSLYETEIRLLGGELLILPGEELGNVIPDLVPGIGSYGHSLAYGISGYTDSGYWSHCQDMITATQEKGGVGFIAHPYTEKVHDFFPWADWNVTGYSGVEVINSGSISTFVDSSWDYHLGHEASHRSSGRKPPSTHVGIGNSDAHWPQGVGSGKTYVRAAHPFSHSTVIAALTTGRCVASNGPLVVCELDGSKNRSHGNCAFRTSRVTGHRMEQFYRHFQTQDNR